MKKIGSINIILFIFFIGCEKNPVNVDTYFNKQEKLHAEKIIPIKDLYIKFPKIYNLTDSSLVISAIAMNFTSNDHLICIIGKHTGKIIKELGKGGRGPDELTTLSNIDKLNNKIVFYDPMSRKILLYENKTDSVSHQTLGAQKKYMYRNLYMIDDNKFLSSGDFENSMYYYGDLSTGECSLHLSYPYLPDIPEDKQENFQIARSLAFSGNMVKQPGGKRLAYYARSAGYLQIIEISTPSIEEVMHWYFAHPTGKLVNRGGYNIWVQDMEKSTDSFLSGTASKKFIYLLYSGKPRSHNKGSKVFVFDWNGNRIKILELDQEVKAISIDREDRNIYAITINDKTLNSEIIHYVL